MQQPAREPVPPSRGILVCGSGGVVAHHVRGAQKASIPVVGLWSRTPAHAAQAAAALGVPVVVDLVDALADDAVHGVVVAVATEAHRDVCLAAIRHGRPVLVEKPVGLGRQEAEAMAEAAARRGVFAQAGYMKWHHPVTERLRALLPSVGPVRYVRLRTQYPVAEGAWDRIAHGDRRHGGALRLSGSHVLAVLLGLFGPPRVVGACFHERPGCQGFEDVALAHLELPGGVPCAFEATWLPRTAGGVGEDGWEEELEIVGAQARVVVQWPFWHQSAWIAGRIWEERGRERRVYLVPPEDQFQRQMEAFWQAITGGAPARPTLAEAVAVHRLMEEIREAAEVLRS